MRNFLGASLFIAACVHTPQAPQRKQPGLICPSESRPVEGTKSPGFTDVLSGEIGKKITACLDGSFPSFEALEGNCKRSGGKVTLFDWDKDGIPAWGCAVVMESFPEPQTLENTDK